MKRSQFVVCLSLISALSACNSTDATLGVESTAPPAANLDVSQSSPATPATQTSNSQQKIASNSVRMRFAPIIGAPVEKVTPLTRRLSARAKENNVAILASTDQTASHVLKGYFSVLNEGSASTVIYVFDVLDPAGNRLHRIQGQESAAASNAAQGWVGVSETLMESIADKAFSEFYTWLSVQNT